MERQSSYKIKLESFKFPRSVFSRQEISMVLIEFLVVSVKGTTVVFLEGPLTLSNVYQKVKIFEIIESRKPRETQATPLV